MDKYRNDILALSERDKIFGEIYIVTNKINNKQYIGQTVSHRKNNNKLRPHGGFARFKQHISTALKNTRKNGSVALYNAIRKYGKDNFECKIAEICCVDDMDKKEIEYIQKYNTLYPNGYNLTSGGKHTTWVSEKIENNGIINHVVKRGREFGYKHKKESIDKIKKKINEPKNIERAKIQMKNTMEEFYDKQKIEKISKHVLDKDYVKYIRPVYRKDTGELYNYIIRISRNVKYTISGKNNDLEKLYTRLKNIMKLAYELSIKNK